MEIIGAGLPRTGTTSAKIALEQLDFAPCYHMMEVQDGQRNPDHLARWHQAADGAVIDWRDLFAGYRATVDLPAAVFYEELMQVYPDARVLLTVRDPARWYDSVGATIWRLSRVQAPELEDFQSLLAKLFWHGILDSRFDDPAHAIRTFERHVAAVKRRVPAERLLVFDVREGWGPLCRFLQVPQPSTPFPQANDTETFDDYLSLRWPPPGTSSLAHDYETGLRQRLRDYEEKLLAEYRKDRDPARDHDGL